MLSQSLNHLEPDFLTSNNLPSCSNWAREVHGRLSEVEQRDDYHNNLNSILSKTEQITSNDKLLFRLRENCGAILSMISKIFTEESLEQFVGCKAFLNIFSVPFQIEEGESLPEANIINGAQRVVLSCDVVECCALIIAFHFALQCRAQSTSSSYSTFVSDLLANNPCNIVPLFGAYSADDWFPRLWISQMLLVEAILCKELNKCNGSADSCHLETFLQGARKLCKIDEFESIAFIPSLTDPSNNLADLNTHQNGAYSSNFCEPKTAWEGSPSGKGATAISFQRVKKAVLQCQAISRWNCEAVSPLVMDVAAICAKFCGISERLILIGILTSWIQSFVANPLWLDRRTFCKRNIFESITFLAQSLLSTYFMISSEDATLWKEMLSSINICIASVLNRSLKNPFDDRNATALILAAGYVNKILNNFHVENPDRKQARAFYEKVAVFYLRNDVGTGNVEEGEFSDWDEDSTSDVELIEVSGDELNIVDQVNAAETLRNAIELLTMELQL